MVIMLEYWQYKRLTKILLFAQYSPEEIQELFRKHPYRLNSYVRGNQVAARNTVCRSLLVLLDGKLQAGMADHHQNRIIVEMLQAPCLVAPAFLFGRNPRFPVDIEVLEPSIVLSLSRETVLGLFQDDVRILTAFLDLISSRTQFLSQRLHYLTTRNIREKIIQYLLQLSVMQENRERITLPISVTQLSELLAVSRPALSRGFKEMADSGMIARQGRVVHFLDKERFGG